MKTNLSFEARVISLICVLGLLRMSVGIYQMVTVGVSLTEQIINCCFILFFVFNLYHALSGRYSGRAVAFFCYVLLFMLSMIWLVRDGLSSSTDAVFIAVIVVCAAVSKGRFLIVIVCTALAVEIMLLLFWLNFPTWLDSFKSDSQNELLSYQALIILTSLVVFFMSYRYQGDLDKLAKRSAQIRLKIKELEKENSQIEKNRVEIERINAALEAKVATRVSHLMEASGKIAKYIRLSSQEIAPSLTELTSQIDELSRKKSAPKYFEWLKKSGMSLTHAFNNVKSSYEKRMNELI